MSEPILPKDGQKIKYRKKGGFWSVGTVDFVWHCLDCMAIKLTNGDQIFVELGDEWKAA